MASLGGLSITRPLLVTDRGLVATGMVDRVTGLIGGPVTLFEDTPANPTEDAVDAAFTVYRGAGCDGIVALGGGSSIDLARRCDC